MVIFFLMCHLPWKIFGLPHTWVVPSDVVNVLSLSVACAETCVVPLVFILAWISRQPVCGCSTLWLFRNSACLLSVLIPNNYPECSVSVAPHFACQHI